MVIGPLTVCHLPFVVVVVVVLGLLGDGGMRVAIVPQLPLELAFVRGLRPQDLVQALMSEGMDVSRLDALGLHPNDETDAHARVLEFGTLDVVGELQLGPRSVDVGLGQGDGRAGDGGGSVLVATALRDVVRRRRAMAMPMLSIGLECKGAGGGCARSSDDHDTVRYFTLSVSYFY